MSSPLDDRQSTSPQGELSFPGASADEIPEAEAAVVLPEAAAGETSETAAAPADDWEEFADGFPGGEPAVVEMTFPDADFWTYRGHAYVPAEQAEPAAAAPAEESEAAPAIFPGASVLPAVFPGAAASPSLFPGGGPTPEGSTSEREA